MVVSIPRIAVLAFTAAAAAATAAGRTGETASHFRSQHHAANDVLLVEGAGDLSVAEAQSCERWAVLTFDLQPADKAKQLADMGGWCVLVIGDEEGRPGPETDVAGVSYLSRYSEEKLPYRIAGPGVSNNSGRKNVAYMYAIHHGAQVIFDVDTESYLTDFLAELPLYETSNAVVESPSKDSHVIDRKGFSSTFLRPQKPQVQAHGATKEALALRQDWLRDLRDAGYGIKQYTEEEAGAKTTGGISAAAHPTVTVERALAEGTSPGVDVREVEPSGGGKKPHVLLVIAIVSARSDRRASIRDSWRKWGDERVEIRFFTEAPSGGGSDDAVAAAALEEEMAAHGDLLIMDIEPGMNFALKLLWGMRWMSEHYTFDFFLRLDDDYFLCLERLLNELDATVAAAQRPLKIYAGHRYCDLEGQIRIDEAYLLLSAPLVDRILTTNNLWCGGHGGVTAAWWFTAGRALNKRRDVEWVHDFRLDHDGDLFLADASRHFPNVCATHMGVHHAYADTIPQMWKAAQGRPGPGPNDKSRAGSLLRYVDDGTCRMVDAGVSKEFFDIDDPQPCDTFKAKDVAVHCGAEGCVDPPHPPAELPAESQAVKRRWWDWSGRSSHDYVFTVLRVVSFVFVFLVLCRCAKRVRARNSTTPTR